MKRLIFVAGILMIGTTLTFANYDNGSNKSKSKEAKSKELKSKEAKSDQGVSFFFEEQFERDFPNASNVQFSDMKELIEVSFMQGTKQLTAYYDVDDELLGTQEEKQFSDLPAKAQTQIRKNYPDYRVATLFEFVGNQDDQYNMDMVLYGEAFHDTDNYFVELKSADKAIVVKVDPAGEVTYFSTI